MNNLNNVINILESFGHIEEVVEEDKVVIYVLKCKTSRIIEDSFLKKIETINFLIALREEGNSIIACFNIASKDDFEGGILELINTANENITYGKFVLDDSNIINWNKTFDMDLISQEDIKDYIHSCLVGIKLIFINGKLK